MQSLTLSGIATFADGNAKVTSSTLLLVRAYLKNTGDDDNRVFEMSSTKLVAEIHRIQGNSFFCESGVLPS